jgi:hypothetical protein
MDITYLLLTIPSANSKRELIYMTRLHTQTNDNPISWTIGLGSTIEQSKKDWEKHIAKFLNNDIDWPEPSNRKPPKNSLIQFEIYHHLV